MLRSLRSVASRAPRRQLQPLGATATAAGPGRNAEQTRPLMRGLQQLRPVASAGGLTDDTV